MTLSTEASASPLGRVTAEVKSVARSVGEKAYTGFLFARSDVESIIGPVVTVSMVLVGPTDILAFGTGIIWLLLHLITFDIQNQILGLEEDRLSKPSRPIVSGRVSLADAQALYYAFFALSFMFSVFLDQVHSAPIPIPSSMHHLDGGSVSSIHDSDAYLDSTYGYTGHLWLCSAIYLSAIIAYNECGLSRVWYMKSLLGSVGYVCYSWGVCVVFNRGERLPSICVLAIFLSGAIHTTTGHAQDFRDRSGDAAINRRTLPLLLPQPLARSSLLLLILIWTAALLYVWSPPMVLGAGMVALGGKVGKEFVCNWDWDEERDREAYWWYNMWLTAAHMLPLCARLRGDVRF